MKNQKTEIKLAVVILTYNAREYLHDCLASVVKQDYTDIWEIIVIDNNSSDDTAEFIKENYPRITLIVNNTNIGFAAGNNIGIRYALKSGCQAVVLLNQDTIVRENFLTELVKAAYSDSSIGAAQSLLLLHPETHLVNSTGNRLHYLGFGYTDNYRKDEKDVTETLKGSLPEIAYPSGAAVLFKLEAIKQAGMFDETFFMYNEDADLGWRLWLAGWRVILAPASVVFHKYSFQKSLTKYYYMERNRLLFLIKNYSLKFLLLISPILLITEVGLDLFSIQNGFWRQRARAWIYLLKPSVWVNLLAKRREIKAVKKVPERKLIYLLSDEILFQDIESFMVNRIANPLWRGYWKIIKKII